MFHICTKSNEGVLEAFQGFIQKVLEDQQLNRKNDDDLIDAMWDESIKVKTRAKI